MEYTKLRFSNYNVPSRITIVRIVTKTTQRKATHTRQEEEEKKNTEAKLIDRVTQAERNLEKQNKYANMVLFITESTQFSPSKFATQSRVRSKIDDFNSFYLVFFLSYLFRSSLNGVIEF